jgi:hypothetical protein
MSHYVIIDGVLQRSSPETKRWIRRAAKATPSNPEEPQDTVALFQVDHEPEEEQE